MPTITRTNMSPFIAVSKVNDVARLIRMALRSGEQAAVNERLISEARHMARQGRSIDAFRHLSHAAVPAGTVKACCMLRSRAYGCSSHGYPRSI